MVLTEALHAGLAALVRRPAALAAGLEAHAGTIVFDTLQRASGELALPTWSDAVASFVALFMRAATAHWRAAPP
jgi:hypothetical protein